VTIEPRLKDREHRCQNTKEFRGVPTDSVREVRLERVVAG
jgi:hypothetical protein